MRSIVVLASLAVLLPGCATMQRENFVRERAGEYVYDKPLDEVWPHVRALLVAQGYVPVARSEPNQLDTEWREETAGGSGATTWSRYRVVGSETGGQSKVVFLKNTRSGGSGMPAAPRDDLDNAGTGGEDKGTRKTATAGRYTQGEREGGDADYDARPTEETRPDSLRAGTRKDPVTGTRDLAMEWLLLQRVAPEAASTIYSDAEAKFR